MKALQLIVIALVVLAFFMGARQGRRAHDTRSLFERTRDGLAVINHWGRYAFWAAIAVGVLYAVIALVGAANASAAPRFGGPEVSSTDSV